MSRHATDEFDTDSGDAPARPGQLSANGHWIFGSIYAAMALVGFGFGVWAGAAKPKPLEIVQNQPETSEKLPVSPTAKPQPPAVTPPPPTPNPAPPEPKAKEPESKPEPKVKEPEPEPKPKEPEPKPKAKEPESKPVAKAISFKEVQPILRTYCFDCHGAAGKPKGKVDVTSIAKMLASKGPPLVPGKPKESSIYTTIKSGDMPPDGKKGPSQQELQLIHDWIASGAKERRRTIRTRSARGIARRRLELTRVAGAG